MKHTVSIVSISPFKPCFLKIEKIDNQNKSQLFWLFIQLWAFWHASSMLRLGKLGWITLFWGFRSLKDQFLISFQQEEGQFGIH